MRNQLGEDGPHFGLEVRRKAKQLLECLLHCHLYALRLHCHEGILIRKYGRKVTIGHNLLIIMKTILVPTLTFELATGSNAPVEGARRTYLRALIAVGLMPMCVSWEESKEMIHAKHRACHGVLLMGGVDLNPGCYGAVAHPETKAGESLRDELEINLIRKSLADRLPLLAICRGHQAVNVACGGTLLQHLPDVVPETTERHRVPDAKGYDFVHKNRHDIIVVKESRLGPLLWKYQPHELTEISAHEFSVNTNSGHHQAIGIVGTDLVVSARSPAGIIEAVEHADPDYPFLLGIQSHPEVSAHEPLNVVFRAFSDAVHGFPKR